MTFKQKFENFKYYYKWHTIVAIFVIAITAFGVKSCVDSKEPDINILYVSDKFVSDDTSEKFQKILEDNNLIKDINKDEREYFFFESKDIDYKNKYPYCNELNCIISQLENGTKEKECKHKP